MLLSGVEHNLISFVGNVTISNIAQAHDEIGVALRQEMPVAMDLDAITEVDLTFVQLIEAARRKAGEAGRDFILLHSAGPAVLEVLRRGGFLDDETSDRAAFWLQGAAQ